jgi:CubicO group peptidase (beta-lactamase class C family)
MMKTTAQTLTFMLVLTLMSGAVTAGEKPRGDPLTQDTSATTFRGNPFTAPKDWYLSVKGPATFIEAPEGGSRIVLVDVEAEDAEAALKAAWAAYKEPGWELETVEERVDWNGFSLRKRLNYRTSPNENRSVIANAGFANGGWNVWIYDMANDVGEQRSAQVGLLLGSLWAKGYSRESFAGKQVRRLNGERISQLTSHVEKAIELTGVPGVGLGIIQDGKVVYAGGFGVRELGKPEKINADTLFMVASNTKAMATLLLARLVDAGKMTWQTPVTELMPSFKLGDEQTTSRTLVEHLICACTGLPRNDMPWIFEFEGLTAEDSFRELAAVQPTTNFGEMYQYSNNLAAAAGYVGGRVAYPDLELGAAFDKAMQTEVFGPLGMDSTTFDFEKAMSGNYASAHSTTIDGKPAHVPMDWNFAVVHLRPAGGAWSNVEDMLKYIQMEIDEGVLPNGKRYISSESLLERRQRKVSTGSHSYYGMGLGIDESWGVTVVHHGGDMLGQHSDMMWLPGHGVGAVVLTNGDPGWLIRSNFQRKLLEVLFDGQPRALEDLTTATELYYDGFQARRSQYDLPANKEVVETLAVSYRNNELGEISVSRDGGELIFDFGEFTNAVTTKSNPDGTLSFVSISPGWTDFEWVAGDGQTLILRDSQHEYVFVPDESR